MKYIVILIILFSSFWVFGEETFSLESEHYKIVSHLSESNAQLLGDQLESFYEIFNDVFRFENLESKLNVQILPNQNTFETFTTNLTGRTYDSFIYIHHQRSEDSELLIYEGSEEDLIHALVYQASIQFIMNHIEKPPMWVREGFSVYFSKSSGPELERKFAILKEKESRISIENLIKMDSDEIEPIFTDFRTESWAFVTFLMSTENKEYTRFLWDSLTKIKMNTSREISIDNDIQRGFDQYIENFLDAQELMEMGMKHYNENNPDLAMENFDKASSLSPISWQPIYYLALISLEQADYDNADLFYDQAAEKGAPQALIAYNKGLTAFYDERVFDARDFFKIAVELDEEKYGELTIKYIEHLDGTKSINTPLSIP